MDETQTQQAESSNDTAYADIYSEDGSIRADYLDRIDRFIEEEDVEALAEPALGHRMAMRYDPTGKAPTLTALINDLARKAA